MERETKASLTNTKTWLRGLFLLFFALVGWAARLVICAIAIFQFISTLLTEKKNIPLSRFGLQLNTYVFQIGQFLTFNDNALPFPFNAWPTGKPHECNLEEDDSFNEEQQDLN